MTARLIKWDGSVLIDAEDIMQINGNLLTGSESTRWSIRLSNQCCDTEECADGYGVLPSERLLASLTSSTRKSLMCNSVQPPKSQVETVAGSLFGTVIDSGKHKLHHVSKRGYGVQTRSSPITGHLESTRQFGVRLLVSDLNAALLLFVLLALGLLGCCSSTAVFLKFNDLPHPGQPYGFTS
ncbi:hypothetical protein FB45DRAFT_872037 [Roridomyces roridus]|uniref:Uncharacterized protein n=1 Tax=Roridomyces roridus TaxID=1738132 RepID=A0AAD7BEM9_9AGAR|nr:hypothetical protein FB45DRAFT_872037 [Roridomyces roridus]